MLHAFRFLRHLALLAAIVCICAAGWSGFLTYAGVVRRALPGLLSEEATRRLGRQVAVRGAEVRPDGIRLSGVAIADGPVPSARPALAAADEVRIDVPLWRLMLGSAPTGPAIRRIHLTRPAVHIRREASGRWNFDGLFPSRRTAPGKPVIGDVVVAGGSVSYEDGVIRARWPRISPLVQSSADGVHGRLWFRQDGGLAWDAAGRCASGQAASIRCSGSYDAATDDMLLVADARSMGAALAAGAFMPAGVRITGGGGNASAAVSWRAMGPDRRLDYRGTATVQGGSATVPRLGEPIQAIAGTITLARERTSFDLTGRVRSGAVRSRAVFRGYRDPAIDATIDAPRLDLARLLPSVAPGASRAGAAPTGSVTGRARVSGTAAHPSVRIAASVDLRGASAIGVTAGPARLRVDARGAPLDLAVAVTGSAERIAYRGLAARDVAISAGYRAGRGSVDLQGGVAGGRAVARAEVRWRAGAPDYVASGRVRDADLTALAELIGQPVAGRLDADATLRGRGGANLPTGHADVQIYGPSAGAARFQSLRTRVISDGSGRLEIPALVLRDGVSHALIHGSVDTRARTLELEARAEAIALAALFPGLPDPPVAGALYLRDGSIRGPWDDPEISGVLHAFGLTAGGVRCDEVAAAFVGSRSRLLIEDGRVLRAPAEATFEGVVRNPLSEARAAYLSGSFRDLELLDVARIAGSRADVTGRAHGAFVVEGDARMPVARLEPVEVEDAGIGSYQLDHLGAHVEYRKSGPDAGLRVTGLEARLGDATLRASGLLSPGDRFRIEGRADAVDLALFNPEISTYARLGGAGAAEVEIAGSLKGGTPSELAGHVRAQVTGLTVNDVPCGAAAMRVRLEGDRVLPEDPASPSLLALGPETPWLRIGAAARDPKTGDVDIAGDVANLPVAVIRGVLARSRFALEHADLAPSEWLQPPAGTVAGDISSQFRVWGPPASPHASLAWSGRGLRPGAGELRVFTGSADVDASRLVLHSLKVAQTDAMLNASGTWDFGKSIDASVDVTGLSVDDLRPWLPDLPAVRGLRGTLDSIYLQATGKPSEPTITASADVRDLRWRGPEGSALADREIAIHSLQLASATIAEGSLALKDVGVVFSSGLVAPAPASREASQPAPAAAAASGSAPRYEAHVSGSVGFRWGSPYIVPQAPATVTLTIRNQTLPGGRPLFDGAPLEIDGRLDADVTFAGTWEQLLNPRLLADAHSPASWNGRVGLTAARVRYASMRTVLSDLDASLNLTGASIQVDRNAETGRPFAARVDVLDPITGKPLLKGDPIQVSGELPIREGGPGGGLDLSVARLAFAESTIPVFDTGSVAGEFSSADRSRPGIHVALGGTVANPSLAGDLYLRRSDLRVPTTMLPPRSARPDPAIRPRLDLRLHVGEQVRVRTALIAADVRTEPGAPITLVGDTVAPRLNGTLVIDRGWMYFPTTRFALDRGGTATLRYPGIAAVVDAQAGLDVQVNATAVARLTAASVTGSRKAYRVTVEAHGPLFAAVPEDAAGSSDPRAEARGLRLVYRSDPPDLAFTPSGLQDRVVGILGGKEAIAELFAPRSRVGRVIGEGIASAVTAGVLPEVFERSGLGRVLGLDDLSLDYLQGEGVTVRVNRPLVGPFSIGYWRRLERTGFGEPAMWQLKTSMRLKTGLQASWTVDDQRANAYLLEGVFRF